MKKMKNSVSVFPRPELEKSVACLMRRGRSPWSPSVYEIRLDKKSAVWKDLGDRLWIFRLIFQPMFRRETDALKALASLPAVPRLLGVAERDGYVMEMLEAERLPHLSANNLDAAFFKALREAMDRMHALGVAHGDFRRTNILIDRATRQPKIIDFGTAVTLGAKPGWIKRVHWRLAQRIDRLQYAKLKEHYLPGSLTAEEAGWINQAPWYYKLGTALRHKIYRPLKWRNLRKRLWKKSGAAKRRRKEAHGVPQSGKSDRSDKSDGSD